MFLLSRRQSHALLAAAGAGVAYLAAAELSDRKPVRVGGLLALSTIAFAGLAVGKASAKAYNVESRFNNLLSNGGHFGGNVTVAGDHTVQGTLFGSGGVIDVGDQLNVLGNTVINARSIDRDPGSGSANVNITGGGIGIAGNLNMNANNAVSGGQFFFTCSGDSNAGTAGSTYSQSYAQSLANRINDILTYVG